MFYSCVCIWCVPRGGSVQRAAFDLQHDQRLERPRDVIHAPPGLPMPSTQSTESVFWERSTRCGPEQTAVVPKSTQRRFLLERERGAVSGGCPCLDISLLTWPKASLFHICVIVRFGHLMGVSSLSLTRDRL